jgi:preprotein translocase subunit SecF
MEQQHAKQHEQHPVAIPEKSWYDRYYKILMFIPVLIVIASLVYLGVFYSQHGDIMLKDSSLSGGTTITISGDVDASKLDSLKQDFPDLIVRKLSDVRTGKSIASIIESSSPPETLKPALEKTLGYNLTADNSSVEFSGPTLSKGFYNQLITALIIAFVLMSFVIFIMFRTAVPSIAVIFAALSDIIIPLVIIDYLGIKLSAAGIAAFLMLIGYSVDTDILLTTRAIKNKEGFVNERIFRAFKTGILMTLTAIAAVLPAFFIVTGLPDSFRQIFLILALGLFADIANTWLTNAGIIKWYCKAKGIQ